MNDFTKSELIYLHDSAIRSVIEFDNKNLKNIVDDFKKLTQKLQSMTDGVMNDNQ